MLRETLEFLKHEIQDRDVLVEVEAPDALPAVQIDADQIKQAFFNIIRNAIQAMPDGGLLKISLCEHGPLRGRSPSRTAGRASRPRTSARSSSRTTPPSPRARGSA